MRFSPLNRSLNVVFIAHLVFMIIMNRITHISVQRGDECFFLDSSIGNMKLCHLKDGSELSTRTDRQNASVVPTLFDLFLSTTVAPADYIVPSLVPFRLNSRRDWFLPSFLSFVIVVYFLFTCVTLSF